jgi:hypothetical protein
MNSNGSKRAAKPGGVLFASVQRCGELHGRPGSERVVVIVAALIHHASHPAHWET